MTRVCILLLATASALLVGNTSAGADVTAFIAAAVAPAAAIDRLRYHTRAEAIAYLREVRGVPISKSVFTKLCALNQGPEVAAAWGPRHLYVTPALDAWADSRLRPPPRLEAPKTPAVAAQKAKRTNGGA